MKESEYFERASRILAEMQSECPAQIRATDYTLKSKLPFKIGSIHATLCKRSIELGEVSLSLYTSFKVIPAFILTRQCIENCALMYCLSKKLEEIIATNNREELDEFLMTRMFGSRMPKSEYVAANILNAIDQLDKLTEGIREQYDALSEFVHPNSSGVLHGYGSLNSETYTLTIRDSRDLPRMMGIPLLLAALSLTQLFYGKVLRYTKELDLIFEAAG